MGLSATFDEVLKDGTFYAVVRCGDHQWNSEKLHISANVQNPEPKTLTWSSPIIQKKAWFPLMHPKFPLEFDIFREDKSSGFSTTSTTLVFAGHASFSDLKLTAFREIQGSLALAPELTPVMAFQPTNRNGQLRDPEGWGTGGGRVGTVRVSIYYTAADEFKLEVGRSGLPSALALCG